MKLSQHFGDGWKSSIVVMPQVERTIFNLECHSFMGMNNINSVVLELDGCDTFLL